MVLSHGDIVGMRDAGHLNVTQLVFTPPGNLAKFRIDLQKASGQRIDECDAHRRALIHRSKAYFTLPQIALGSFQIGHIDGCPHHPPNLAILVPQRNRVCDCFAPRSILKQYR